MLFLYLFVYIFIYAGPVIFQQSQLEYCQRAATFVHLVAASVITSCIWDFLQMTTSGKESKKAKTSDTDHTFSFRPSNNHGILLWCRGVYITQLQSKEATHVSLHGWRDLGEVAERSLYAEKIEDTDLVWEEGQNREECRLAKSHKTFYVKFLLFWQETD